MSDLYLKPCPWCGDENSAVSVIEICCPAEWSAEVHCTNCDASGGSGGVHAGKAEAEIEAIDVWNCRPAMHDAAPEMYELLASLRGDYGMSSAVGKEIDELLAKARGE